MKKTKLKKILSESIKDTFIKLFEIVDEKSESFNDLILLKGRFKDLNKSIIRGDISYENKRLELAQIRGSLILFIDELVEVKFVSPPNNRHKTNDILPNIDLEENDKIDLDKIDLDFYQDLVTQDYNTLKTSLSLFRSYTNTISNSFAKGTEKMLRLTKNRKPNLPIIARKIDEKVAKDLENYNNRLEIEVPSISKQFKMTISNHIKLIQAQAAKGFTDVEHLNEIRKEIYEINNSLRAVVVEFAGLGNDIGGLSSKLISNKMKKEKVKTLLIHENFQKELEEIIEHNLLFIRVLKEVINKS